MISEIVKKLQRRISLTNLLKKIINGAQARKREEDQIKSDLKPKVKV
jgi:hypothetical protein